MEWLTGGAVKAGYHEVRWAALRGGSMRRAWWLDCVHVHGACLLLQLMLCCRMISVLEAPEPAAPCPLLASPVPPAGGVHAGDAGGGGARPRRGAARLARLLHRLQPDRLGRGAAAAGALCSGARRGRLPPHPSGGAGGRGAQHDQPEALGADYLRLESRHDLQEVELG